MPPPLFIFFIPSIALVFLIQMIICHAYRFQVTLDRQRSKGHPRLEMSSDHDKNRQGPQDKSNQRTPNSPRGRNAQNQSNRNGKNPEYKESNSTNQSSASSNNPKNPKGGVRVSLESQNSTRSSHPTVMFSIPSETSVKSQSPEEVPVVFEIPSETSVKSSGKAPVMFDIPPETSDKSLFPGKTDPLSPKEDRNKSRRKSVFAESYDPSKDNEDIKVMHPKTPDEKKWLKENLKNITLFQHLANDQLNTVVDAMYKYVVSEGEYITKEGDKGNTFYVVQEGIFDVYVRDDDNNEHLVHTYDRDGSFGELALLYNQPRAASIMARTDGTLWAVDGQTFRRIVYKITHQKRVMYESLINNVPMLKALEPYERANLVDALIPVSYEHDQEIVKQGDEADGMYFIVSGGVRVVYHNKSNKPILLNELSNSDYFGELALVADQPRAASAYAVGTTHLAFLDREAFERLLGPCMEIMRRKVDEYNERLSDILSEKSKQFM